MLGKQLQNSFQWKQGLTTVLVHFKSIKLSDGWPEKESGIHLHLQWFAHLWALICKHLPSLECLQTTMKDFSKHDLPLPFLIMWWRCYWFRFSWACDILPMWTSDILKHHGNLLLLLDGRCLEILIVNSRSAKPSVKQQCCLWFWLFASDSNFDFLRIFNSRSARLSINQHHLWLLGWLLANSWMSNSWNVILTIWNNSSAAVDCDSLKVFKIFLRSIVCPSIAGSQCARTLLMKSPAAHCPTLSNTSLSYLFWRDMQPM